MAQFKRKDGYALMNLVVKELTGQDIKKVVDTRGFIDAGTLVAEYKTDEIFNAISIVFNRLRIAVRSYQAKLWLIDSIDNDVFSNRWRKISVYSNFALPSGWYNTDLYTSLAEGFDNGKNNNGVSDQSVGSMFEQHYMHPLEMDMGNQCITWQDCLTRPINQIKICVRDESEWLALWNGMAAQFNNDLELQKEAWNRTVLLARIGYALAMGDDLSALKGGMTKVNLTKAFNDYFGTQYTSEQLRTTYLKEFVEFMTVTVKDYSDMLTRPGVYFHAAPVYTDADSQDHVILRHTPKDKQKFMMFAPFWNRAKSMVMPEIFNPNYLDMKNFEPVDFWQTFSTDVDERAYIDVKVTVPGWLEKLITSGSTTVDTAYEGKAYVLGVLFDEDAVMTSNRFVSSISSPVEARKGYVCDWVTYEKSAVCDPSENFVCFVMEDVEYPDDNDDT